MASLFAAIKLQALKGSPPSGYHLHEKQGSSTHETYGMMKLLYAAAPMLYQAI